jgi:hypothetical protein
MLIHQRFHLTRKSAATILVLLSLTFAWLASRVAAQRFRGNTQQACGSSFIGSWQPTHQSLRGGVLTISVNPDNLSASFTLQGHLQKILNGKITGDSFNGSWYDAGQKGQIGYFTATLHPTEHLLTMNLYSTKQQLIETTEWTCEQAGSHVGQIVDPFSRTGTSTQRPTPTPTPIPSPTAIPTPTPIQISPDKDVDHFNTFDSLPMAQQETSLVNWGPRLERTYNASDLNMRVFVQGGAPLVIDYELDSDAPAVISIGVAEPKLKPLLIRLEPAKRTQRTITLPDHLGPAPQVGKVHISALTQNGEPANFRLYGMAMGQMGSGALNKLISKPPYAELAMNGYRFGPAQEYEQLPLFAFRPPQGGSVIDITVSPPTTIRLGQRPKQEVAFSFTPHSLFDNGRWELLEVNGLNEEFMWEKKTGRITPNKTLSEKWDGIKHSSRMVSPGDHSLVVRAWRGDASRAFVIARAPENIVVNE